MGRNGRLAALSACALVLGCSAEVERTTASFALTRLASCPIAGLQRLELTVVGDFPSQQSGAKPAGQALALDALPIDARALSIDARLSGGRAAALAPLPSEQADAPLLLMPLDASCPLGDTLVAAPAGSAVAATPGGALLVAGGRADDGASLRGVVMLPRGSELGRQVEGGLLLPRAFATATPIEGGVLVAGGGADDDGPAYDTFEIFDEAAGRLLAARRFDGGGRRRHGAARLPDGRVVLVGGVAEQGGEALGSAVVIDPETDTTRVVSGMREARVDPTVLVLDDGAVLVLLGRRADTDDAELATGVERLGPEGNQRYASFARVASLPARTHAVVAPLEGGRVAWLGCASDEDGDDVEPGVCELQLLVPAEGSELELVPNAISAASLLTAEVDDLSNLRLAPLRDGKLLLLGRKDDDARAWLLDLTRGEVTGIDATRAPDQLVELVDGTLAELDAFGASLRRHDARSAFHDPPAALLAPEAWTVDRPARARFGEHEVRAEGGPVRLDLPHLRFGKLRVELALEGEGRVLLEPEHAPPIAIELGASHIALGDCELARSDGDATLVLERSGAALTLRSGDARRTCSERALTGLLGLALGLDDGARLHVLRVERR
jgi:hypothetical protein